MSIRGRIVDAEEFVRRQMQSREISVPMGQRLDSGGRFRPALASLDTHTFMRRWNELWSDLPPSSPSYVAPKK